MRNFRAPLPLILLATVSLATSAAVVAQEQITQAPLAQDQGTGLPPGQVPAVLRAREVDFIYRSSTNIFSCDDLRRHVSVALRAVGARDDVEVTAHECEAFIAPDPTSPTSTSSTSNSATFDRGGGYDPTSRTSGTTSHLRSARDARYRTQSTPVHVQLMLPTPVTPEILAEMDRDKSRRALISRVTNNPSAALDDPIVFAAEHREVALSHDSIGLEAIDCELLEQMVPSVFRELDLKVTGQTLSCDTRQRSHFLPRLTVEALLPVGMLMPGEQKEKEKKEKQQQRESGRAAQ